MASDALLDDWRKFSLTEAEAPGFAVEEDAMGETITIGAKCLLGKLVTDKFFSKEALKAMMLRLWGASRGITVKTIKDNLFVFQFPDEYERTRVMNGSPWLFDNSLLALKEFDGSTPAAQVQFTHSWIWVQLHGIPLYYMTRETGERVGGTIGMVKEVDVPENGVGWGNALRVRLYLDFTQPIPRGRLISFTTIGQMWVSFKYERLPWICFHCGLIGHLERDCIAKLRAGQVEDSAFKQYGPWLRASEPTQRRRGVGTESFRQGPTVPRQETNTEARTATRWRSAATRPAGSQSENHGSDSGGKLHPDTSGMGLPSLSQQLDDESQSTRDSIIPNISFVEENLQGIDIEAERNGMVDVDFGIDNPQVEVCMHAEEKTIVNNHLPHVGPPTQSNNQQHVASTLTPTIETSAPNMVSAIDDHNVPEEVAVQQRITGSKSWKRLARGVSKTTSKRRGALKRLLELDEEVQPESSIKRPKVCNTVQSTNELSSAEAGTQPRRHQ